MLWVNKFEVCTFQQLHFWPSRCCHGVLAVDGDPAVADVHAVAGTHAVAGVYSVVGTTVTGSYALDLVHAVADTYAVESVSVVDGRIVAGILASRCCSMMFLLLLVLPSPMHHYVAAWCSYCCFSSIAYAGKVFRSLWRDIPPCRKSLIPGAGSRSPDQTFPAWGNVKKTL